MIKVNLLGVQKKKKRKQKTSIPIPVILSIIVTLIAIGLAGYFFFDFNKKIKTLLATKSANQQKITVLNKKLGELKDVELLVKEFQKKHDTIKQLRKDQSKPVKLLNEISKLLPDNTWLKEMSVKSNKLSLKGSAFTNTEIVKYVNNLKNTDFFTDVYLSKSESRTIKTGENDIEIYEFAIEISIKI